MIADIMLLMALCVLQVLAAVAAGACALALRDQVRACGSSPHTRGAPSSRMNSSKMSGIIPAYAGSTGMRPVRAL